MIVGGERIFFATSKAVAISQNQINKHVWIVICEYHSTLCYGRKNSNAQTTSVLPTTC